MKIANINNLYKPYNKGGAEKSCERLILELEKEGNSCFVITSKPKKFLEANQSPKTYYLNSSYYNLNQKNIVYRFFWQIGNIFNFGQADKIKKILLSEKPDLVISHNLMGIGIKTFKIIEELNIEHHHVLHDIQLIHPAGLIIFGQEKIINSLPAKIYQKIIKKIVGSPNKIISPSNWLLQEHLKKGYFPKSKTLVRPNPQPFAEKKEIIRDKNKEQTEFVFLGQLEKHKGIIFLIETFKKIDNTNIKLKIVGDGSLMENIKLLTQNDTRIQILGPKNPEIIAQILQEADCLIVPSLCYENSPTVIREAKNFNLPIIASNLGGIPELINGPQEKLFQPGNSEDLIIKIKEIIKK